MNSPHYKTFLRIIIGISLTLLVLIAVINTIVDPYGMFRLVEIEGFNKYKPQIYRRVRILKAYELRRQKPDSVVLGSSRCHLGFRPSHEGWAQLADNRYNLAFDGAMTKEMYYYLRHAHALNPLKLVILGLDNYHPTQVPATTRPDFDPTILLSDNSLWSHIKMWLSDIRILISFDTLMNSYETIKAQAINEERWFAPDGQRLGDVFFRLPGSDYITKGPRAYFDEVDAMEVRNMLEWKIPTPPAKKVYPPKINVSDPETSIDYVRKIVRFCRNNEINLHIFLTPAHVHQFEVSTAAGERNFTENAKRTLIQMIDEENQAFPEQALTVYDFSGYSPITTERLPPKESHDEMTYYWESSHFKEITGDLVLDRLLGSSSTNDYNAANFGIVLTQDTIESVIASTRTHQEQYHTTFPVEIEILRTLVEDFKSTHNIPD